jgi:hypothetical protein
MSLFIPKEEYQVITHLGKLTVPHSGRVIFSRSSVNLVGTWRRHGRTPNVSLESMSKCFIILSSTSLGKFTILDFAGLKKYDHLTQMPSVTYTSEYGTTAILALTADYPKYHPWFSMKLMGYWITFFVNTTRS